MGNSGARWLIHEHTLNGKKLLLFGISILILVVQLIAAMMVGYLMFLTIIAALARRTTKLIQSPDQRFVILIPAHNEENLLPGSLASLNQMEYPSPLFSVHVVADNCVDQTASVAAAYGAVVHTRVDQTHKGKGEALNWLYKRLVNSGESYDAVVILDADTIVSKNFLKVIAARLAHGERIIQAYYTVRDPNNSWTESLRFAALSLVHYVRPQGRMMLGGSAGLKGNGMAFAREVLEQRSWSASLTEDIEMHMNLLLDGNRVILAPDAMVWGEMPDNLAKSQSQHDRWEIGRIQTARKYIPKLWAAGWQRLIAGNFKNAYLLFDASMELIIPPFSVLVSANLSLVFIDLILFGIFIWHSEWLYGFESLLVFNLALGMLLLIGQFSYLFVGLWIARVPGFIYKNLLYAPILVCWKIWHYLMVLTGRTSQGWIRTRRNEV